MKFDVIVGNPPYVGALHQEFFNKAVEKLKPSGAVVFIQPATQFYNKKDKKTKATSKMLENVQKYQTQITLLKDSPFDKTLALFSGVAITRLRRTENESPGRISKVLDTNGVFHENIRLSRVNILSMNPTTYATLRAKIESAVEQHGCLQSIFMIGRKRLKVSWARGRLIRKKDFFTFISANPKEQIIVDSPASGLRLKSKAELPGMISYLKTYVARFCLSLLKFNLHLNSGELRLVPMVDFTQNWNDKKLCKLFGITKEEYTEIERCIPQYYPDVPYHFMKGKYGNA